MGKKLTQKDRILRHLETTGSITPLVALREYGCMRLASRISDLRKDGVAISSRKEPHVNKYGEKISYSRYTLIK